MDEARQASNWEMCSHILAILERCQTGDAERIRFDPERWNLFNLKKTWAAREEERKRKEAEAEAAKNDPMKLAELRAEKLAMWEAFKQRNRISAK